MSPAAVTTVPMTVVTPADSSVDVPVTSRTRELIGAAAMAPFCTGATRCGAISVIMQDCPMSNVRSILPMPSHIAQLQRQVGQEFGVELLVAALPEVLVVT